MKNNDIRKHIRKMQKNIKQMKEAIALLQVVVELTKTTYIQALTYERLITKQKVYKEITDEVINNKVEVKYER